MFSRAAKLIAKSFQQQNYHVTKANFKVVSRSTGEAAKPKTEFLQQSKDADLLGFQNTKQLENSQIQNVTRSGGPQISPHKNVKELTEARPQSIEIAKAADRRLFTASTWKSIVSISMKRLESSLEKDKLQKIAQRLQRIEFKRATSNLIETTKFLISLNEKLIIALYKNLKNLNVQKYSSLEPRRIIARLSHNDYVSNMIKKEQAEQMKVKLKELLDKVMKKMQELKQLAEKQIQEQRKKLQKKDSLQKAPKVASGEKSDGKPAEKTGEKIGDSKDLKKELKEPPKEKEEKKN